ncbi:MAG TPA: hypothetical protein VFT22_26140 [Kofleriaceae bacterium]|nr:hypothetical protein [Kofleriaceae bacterium]
MGRPIASRAPRNRLPIAVSAAVHAAAVAWVGTRAFTRPANHDVSTTTTIELVPVDRARAAPPTPIDDTPPIEVAVIDLAVIEDRRARAAVTPARPPRAPPPTGTSTPPGAPPGAPRGDAAITVPGAGATSEPAPRTTAPGGLLAMRHGELPRAVLPSGRWDALDHAPRGTAPEREVSTGALQHAGGGSYRSDQGPFVAKVHPDGTVELTDRPSIDPHIALPTPRDLGRGIAAWYESDKGPLGAEGDTAVARHIQVGTGATTDVHAPEHAASEDHATTVIVPVIGGGFEITDYFMRRHGVDPYASKKLRFLDATRDERAQIGGRHRRDQLARAPQIVLRNLEALWASIPDLAARKRALFELWDECAETGDPDLVAGAQAARRLVIGFIRGHLPAGGPDAYTPDELAQLARTQQSKATFQPYE